MYDYLGTYTATHPPPENVLEKNKWVYNMVDTEEIANRADVWLTVHRNSVWIRKTNWMSLFVSFISLLIVAQHVSGNHVSIIRS